jgi:hypothetical protein
MLVKQELAIPVNILFFIVLLEFDIIAIFFNLDDFLLPEVIELDVEEELQSI